MSTIYSTQGASSPLNPTISKELNEFGSFIKKRDLEGLRDLLNGDSNAHAENRPYSYEWRRGELAFDLAHTVIAQKDDLEMVKVILEDPQRITPWEYMNAVQEAVRHNRVAILEFLLPNVNADLFSREIMTLLDYAIRQGYLGIVGLLLKDPEKVTDKYKALQQAMSCYLQGKNNAEQILKLFLNNPDLVSVEDRGTAVDFAAYRSKLTLLQLLLAGHANISSEARKTTISTVMINPTQRVFSNDPTWSAADRLEALALLLEDGSQLSPRDRGDLIKELLDPRSRWIPLDEAHRLWFLKRLLADHAPIFPQARIEALDLALKTSCSTEWDRLDILQLLLENEADNSPEMLEGRILTAIEFSRGEALEFLLERLENPSPLFCFIALQCAVRAHQLPALESLLAFLPIEPETIHQVLTWIDQEACHPGKEHSYLEEAKILRDFEKDEPSHHCRTRNLQRTRIDDLVKAICCNDLDSIHPPIGNSNWAIQGRSEGVLEAAKLGSIDVLKLLLVDQAIIADWALNPSILYAIEGNHLEFLRLLLKNHPVIDLECKSDAIVIAADCDSLDSMRIILEQRAYIRRGFDMGLRNSRKRAIFRLVGVKEPVCGSAFGHYWSPGQESTHLPEMLRLLLTDHNLLDSDEVAEWIRALMNESATFSEHHRIEALSLFLEHHQNTLSIPTKEHLISVIISPDRLAVFENYLEILQLLLEEGSEISSECKDEVIAVAKERNCSQLLELLQRLELRKDDEQIATEIQSETSDSDQRDSDITSPIELKPSGPIKIPEENSDSGQSDSTSTPPTGIEPRAAIKVSNETPGSDQSDLTITHPADIDIELSGPRETQPPSMTPPSPSPLQQPQEPVPQINSPSWTERIEQAWNWVTDEFWSLINWIRNRF